MKRTMMQMYLKGSVEAAALYTEAFGAALTASYTNDDGSYLHAELTVDGHVLALSEALSHDETAAGNTMQFCFHYGEGNEALVKKAYEVLKPGAKVLFSLGPCDFSPLMTDMIDKFGVRWCLFV